MSGPDLVDLYPSVRFLVIYRAGILDMFVSLKAASDVGDFRGLAENQDSIVEIGRDEALGYADGIRRSYESFLAAPDVAARSQTVRYEDLRDRPQDVMDGQVAPFLDVPTGPVTTTRVKQIQRGPEEVVGNWSEIEELAGSSRFLQTYSCGRSLD